MRGIRPKTKTQPDATVSPTPRKGVKFEWPLLLYPASLVLALVALYIVSQSIKRQVSMGPAQGLQRDSADSRMDGRPTSQAPAGENSPAVAGRGSRTNPGGTDALTAEQTGSAKAPTDGAEREAVSDPLSTAADIDQLQGTGKVLAMLRTALREKDHTRIKQCMEDLAALGDAAVTDLANSVNAGGEAGSWAAEALARIGTPVATAALLDAVTQTEDGEYKEELGKRLAAVSNHDSWPLLLDTMTQTDDATIARATAASLSKMADAPVLDEIIARYEAATTEAEMEQLAHLVGNIESSQAADALLSLAGDVASTPQDSLQEAAIEALANVGNAQCVSYLLRRLEATTPGEGSDIYTAITQINSPQAQSQLLYAAAGNKEVSAEYGRTAAIEALKNYPSQETCALLERIIAQDSNTKVVTAASRTLDAIQSTVDTVTANADSLRRSEETLPLQSVVK
ncbi:MAG: HEAT repeat domain-containing protein [Solirubrobacterales bacterium]